MKTNIEITLSKVEIEEAITNWLRAHDWKVKSINFLYGTRTEGFGQSEHDAVFFDGATAKVEKVGKNG